MLPLFPQKYHLEMSLTSSQTRNKERVDSVPAQHTEYYSFPILHRLLYTQKTASLCKVSGPSVRILPRVTRHDPRHCTVPLVALV
ncbi:hypothetical protein E2C01_050487 [Portunus trituberculatus]|uniref:Uncharacterized protein n=1 Tax=Portunus trituberculatus TaxID=210409 RepID=A0A5B7GGI8_PORTR|nr:hypothetical protein [Portunus trituberculatus]